MLTGYVSFVPSVFSAYIIKLNDLMRNRSMHTSDEGS